VMEQPSLLMISVTQAPLGVVAHHVPAARLKFPTILHRISVLAGPREAAN